MVVKIIATGEKSKAILRSKGQEPGKITSSVTTRSKGSSLRVTRDTSGNVQGVKYIGTTGKLSSSDKSLVNRLNVEVNLREQSRRDAVAKKVIDDLNASRLREAQRQSRLASVRANTVSGQFINRQLELMNVNKQKSFYLTAPVSSDFTDSLNVSWAKNFSSKPVSQPQTRYGTVNVNGVVFAPTSNRERQFLKLLNKRIIRDEKIKKAWNDSINRNRFLTRRGNRWYIKAGQGVVTAGLGLIFAPAFIVNGFDKFVVGVAGGLTNKELRGKVFRETKRAIKEAPLEVLRGLDPRKPENWGNILLVSSAIVLSANSLKPSRTSKSKLKSVVEEVRVAEGRVAKANRYVAKARNVPKKIRLGLKNVLDKLRSEKSRLRTLEKDFIKDLKRTSKSDFKKALSQAKKTDPKVQAKLSLDTIIKNKALVKKSAKKLARIERKISKSFKKELSKRMKKLLIERRAKALEEYNIALKKAKAKDKGIKKAVKSRAKTLKAKKKSLTPKGIKKSFNKNIKRLSKEQKLFNKNLKKAIIERKKLGKKLARQEKKLFKKEGKGFSIAKARRQAKIFKEQTLKFRRAKALEEYNIALKKAKAKDKGIKKAVKSRAKTLKAKKKEARRINKLLVSKSAARSRARAGKELRIELAKEYFRLLKIELSRIDTVSANKVVLKIEPVVRRSTPNNLPVKSVFKNVVIAKPKPIASRGGGNALQITRFPESAGFSDKANFGVNPFGNLGKTSGNQQLIIIQESPVTIPSAFRVVPGTIKATNKFYKTISVIGALSLEKQLFVIPKLRNSLVSAYRLGLLGLFDVRVVSKLAIKSLVRTKSAVKTATKTLVKTASRTATDSFYKSKTKQLTKLRRVLRKAKKRLPKKVLLLLPRLKFKPKRRDVSFVVNWLKSVPSVYRPSLIAIFLDITDDKLPSDITGLGIRPVIVSKKTSKVKRSKKSSNKNKGFKRS